MFLGAALQQVIALPQQQGAAPPPEPAWQVRAPPSLAACLPLRSCLLPSPYGWGALRPPSPAAWLASLGSLQSLAGRQPRSLSDSTSLIPPSRTPSEISPSRSRSAPADAYPALTPRPVSPTHYAPHPKRVAGRRGGAHPPVRGRGGRHRRHEQARLRRAGAPRHGTSARLRRRRRHPGRRKPQPDPRQQRQRRRRHARRQRRAGAAAAAGTAAAAAAAAAFRQQQRRRGGAFRQRRGGRQRAGVGEKHRERRGGVAAAARAGAGGGGGAGGGRAAAAGGAPPAGGAGGAGALRALRQGALQGFRAYVHGGRGRRAVRDGAVFDAMCAS